MESRHSYKLPAHEGLNRDGLEPKGLRACSCLQCLTGDQEQTKAGTGGEKLQEPSVDQLAHKAIGFLGGSKPHPSSMLFSLFKALRDAQASNLPADRDSPFDILQYLCL